jgi:hypothetical protein
VIRLTGWREGEKSERLVFNTLSEAKKAAEGFHEFLIRCDSCAAVAINGHFCHETGCPDAWQGEPHYCQECGCLFTPEYRRQTTCVDCQEDVFMGTAP